MSGGLNELVRTQVAAEGSRIIRPILQLDVRVVLFLMVMLATGAKFSKTSAPNRPTTIPKRVVARMA
jgi:hypothetical protein